MPSKKAILYDLFIDFPCSPNSSIFFVYFNKLKLSIFLFIVLINLEIISCIIVTINIIIATLEKEIISIEVPIIMGKAIFTV